MIILHRFTTQQSLYQQLSSPSRMQGAWMVHPYAQPTWRRFASTGDNIETNIWMQAWQAHKQTCLAMLQINMERDPSPDVQAVQAKQQLASQVWALGQTTLDSFQAMADAQNSWVKRCARWLEHLPAFKNPSSDVADRHDTFHWVGFWHEPAMLQAWIQSLDPSKTHHIWWVNQTHEPLWLAQLAPKELKGLSFFPKEVDAYHYDHISHGLDHIKAWLHLPQWTPNTPLGLVIESPVTRSWLARQSWFKFSDGMQMHPWYQSMASGLSTLVNTWVFQQPMLAQWLDFFSQWPTHQRNALHTCLSYLSHLEVIDRGQLEFLSSRDDFPLLAKDWLTLIHTIEKKPNNIAHVQAGFDLFMRAWADPSDSWHGALAPFMIQGLALFDNKDMAYQHWFAWLGEQEVLPTLPSYQIGTLAYVSQQTLHHVVMLDAWVEPVFASSASLQTISAAGSIDVLTTAQYIEETLMGFQRQEATLVYLHANTKNAPYLLKHPLVDSQPIPFIQEREDPSSIVPQASLDVFQRAWKRYQKGLSEQFFSHDELTLPDDGGPMSPSSVQTLAMCPRKFFLRHRLGIHMPRVPDRLLRQPGQLFGTMIHDFLHAWFKQSAASTQTRDDFADLFLGHAKKFISGLAHAYKPMWLKEMRHMQTPLWDYVQKENHQMWKIHQLELSIKPMSLAWLHPTLLFRGRLDRMDRDGQRLRIIDYKTGGFTKKKNDLWEDGQFVQLPLYTAMMEKLHPDSQVAQSEIHHVQTTAVDQACVITHDQWRVEKNSFQTLIQEILTSIDQQRFEPRPGPNMKNCEHCDFQVICGEFRAKAQKDNA